MDMFALTLLKNGQCDVCITLKSYTTQYLHSITSIQKKTKKNNIGILEPQTFIHTRSIL